MDKIVFDKFYNGYDQWYDTPVGRYVDQVETDVVFDLLNPEADEKILDLGCGTGNFSYKLLNGECSVTGVDISKKMLSIARQKSDSTDIDFFEMDGYDLQFDDNTFDKVLSVAAFEFISEPQKVINEMLRVVKPGGTVVIGTIQKGGDWAEMYKSEIFKGSAYEEAMFKDYNDFKTIKPEQFDNHKECLFIPPGLADETYNMENEKEYMDLDKKGGFVCVKYIKEM